MSRVIRFEHTLDVASRSEQPKLRGMIRLEQSGVKASEEKRGRSERSEKIIEREKSRVKREKKSVVRRSERIAKKKSWSRAEQLV